MKILILLLVVSTWGNVYAQTKVKTTMDSVLHSQHLILKRLADLELRDSIARARPDTQDALWRYVTDLRADTFQHREFIKDYYDRMYTTIATMLAVFLGLLSFLGFRSFKEVLKYMKDTSKKRFDENLDKLFASYKKNIEDLQEVNFEQNKQLTTLGREVSEIKRNIHVTRSLSILEYMDAIGANVHFYSEQHIVCISKDYPIRETVETISMEQPGDVEFLEGTKNDFAFTVPKKLPNGCEITMKFTPPLVEKAEPFVKFVKCNLLNGFLKTHEQWEITQPYQCDQEIFELRLPKQKSCKLWLERINKDVNGKDERARVDSEVMLTETDKHLSYKVIIPRDNGPFVSPIVHVVH